MRGFVEGVMGGGEDLMYDLLSTKNTKLCTFGLLLKTSPGTSIEHPEERITNWTFLAWRRMTTN